MKKAPLSQLNQSEQNIASIETSACRFKPHMLGRDSKAGPRFCQNVAIIAVSVADDCVTAKTGILPRNNGNVVLIGLRE